MALRLVGGQPLKSRSNIFLAIVIVLTGLSIWGYRSLKYNLGIDVQGGVRLVYTVSQVQDKNSERSTTLEQDRLATIRVLQRRASGIGALEGSVFAKGADQIVVELPGFTDIEQAKSIMGSTSRLYAYDALNVTTKARTRTYAVGPTKQVNGIPVVTFQRQIGDKQEIDPDNPEYAKIIAQWGTPLLQGADLIDAKPQTLSAGKVIP
ncbi:MAG TPA: hypothetical protein VNI20_03975, partial [Fimbriimonadaceae bacterium]|nr:hypothetical protein [Fimbriimonadaceae bacterium]